MPYVFHEGWRPLKEDRVTRAFRRACKGANVDNHRFHDLRHEFASKLVQKGQDLYVVQSVLGHSDGRMTQRYAHLRVESLKKAVKTLDEGHNKGHSVKEEGAAFTATP